MVELLIYVLLASAITAGLSQVLISVIRSDRNIDLQQCAIDLWSRISFLIDSDVAEGNQILYARAGTQPPDSLFSEQRQSDALRPPLP
jgi:hypothetical protein